jgi:uncharacterized membrane protein YgcG
MSILRDQMTIHLRCLGSFNNSNRQFLNGITGAGALSLSPNFDVPFSGATWMVVGTPATDVFLFQCLGSDGTGFLDGRTVDSSVGLVAGSAIPSVPPFTGTRWKVTDDAFVGEHIVLECLGRAGLRDDEHRFLDGRTIDNQDGVSPVALAPQADVDTHSGTHWEIIVADGGNDAVGGGGGNPGGGSGGGGSTGGNQHF